MDIICSKIKRKVNNSCVTGIVWAKRTKKPCGARGSVTPQSAPLLGSSSPIPCNSVMMHTYYVDT